MADSEKSWPIHNLQVLGFSTIYSHKCGHGSFCIHYYKEKKASESVFKDPLTLINFLETCPSGGPSRGVLENATHLPSLTFVFVRAIATFTLQSIPLGILH